MKINLILLITIFTILVTIRVEGKKISLGSWSRGSAGRSSSSSSSRRTNYNPRPAPTSHSYPQPSAPKPQPTLFAWQEKPAQKAQTTWQSKPSSQGQSHSYPSSNTGLSGNQPKQPPSYQESVQRNSASSNTAHQQTHTNNQPSHSYPSSNGLSGSGGQPGHGYPQQHGSSLSGNGNSYPQQHGTGLSGSGSPQQIGGGYPHQQGSGLSGIPAAPPPYSGYKPGQNYQSNNHGNNYYHPPGPPPPYSSSNFGGYGGHGQYNPGYTPQMPGYFGNYANAGKGYGSVSRTGSALTGVGIAGAGIGTVLTGLALWNLARSTGNHHHTVIYDNRGQPVAVAPANETANAVDPILADLVNCTLSINNGNTTEVLAIPCAIATSFTPEADIKNPSIKENTNDNTKCTVTVVTKAGREFMTTIPCSILLNTAAENNVTESDVVLNDLGDVTNNTTDLGSVLPLNNNTLLNEPTALKLTDENTDHVSAHLNCTPHPGEVRDPINPCYSVRNNLTVIPLSTTDAPK